jgi:hypothetical protein
MSSAGLVDVIHWLEGTFDRLGLRRSYRGAIAYNYYGPPRLTQDVDVLVLIPDLKAPAFVPRTGGGRLRKSPQIREP